MDLAQKITTDQSVAVEWTASVPTPDSYIFSIADKQVGACTPDDGTSEHRYADVNGTELEGFARSGTCNVTASKLVAECSADGPFTSAVAETPCYSGW